MHGSVLAQPERCTTLPRQRAAELNTSLARHHPKEPSRHGLRSPALHFYAHGLSLSHHTEALSSCSCGPAHAIVPISVSVPCSAELPAPAEVPALLSTAASCASSLTLPVVLTSNHCTRLMTRLRRLCPNGGLGRCCAARARSMGVLFGLLGAFFERAGLPK